MRLGSIKGLAAAAVAAGLLTHSLAARPTLGDEPRGLGRLFRMGGGTNSSSRPPSPPNPSASPTATPATASTPNGYYGQPALSTPPTTLPGSPRAGRRSRPRPRVSKPATEADPLVTRVSLGRSDDGTQFAMFLQVYADGTIIDNSGVHKVGGEVLKPVVDAIAGGRPRPGQGPLRRPRRRLRRERLRRRLRPRPTAGSAPTRSPTPARPRAATTPSTTSRPSSKPSRPRSPRMSPAPDPRPPPTASAPAPSSTLTAPPLPLTTLP